MQAPIKHCSSVGELMFRAIARIAARLLDRITALGQREAAQRAAHLLLEPADRISISSNKIAPIEFQMLLTQDRLGSIAGITPVHEPVRRSPCWLLIVPWPTTYEPIRGKI